MQEAVQVFPWFQRGSRAPDVRLSCASRRPPPTPRMAGLETRRWAGGRLFLGALLGVPLAACEIPSGLPAWDSTWELPGDSLRLEVAGLLPSGVTQEGDSAFVVTPPPFVVRAALSELCSPCAGLGGILLPKPAIQGSFVDHGELPADVLGVTLRSGAVEFRVTNGLGFDPIRPGGGAPGSLRLVLRSHPDGRVLADTLLSGAVHALPPGASLLAAVALRPGPVGSGVVGEVGFDSPAGSPALLRGTDAFQVEVVPGELRVSDARVEARGRSLDPTSGGMGSGGIDDGLLERVQGGRLRLMVDNPFGVGADLVVRLHAPGEVGVERDVRVAPDGGISLLDYSGAELRRFLGREGARWTVTGAVDPGGGAISVRPGAAAVVRGSFLLTLSVGG